MHKELRSVDGIEHATIDKAYEATEDDEPKHPNNFTSWRSAKSKTALYWIWEITSKKSSVYYTPWNATEWAIHAEDTTSVLPFKRRPIV